MSIFRRDFTARERKTTGKQTFPRESFGRDWEIRLSTLTIWVRMRNQDFLNCLGGTSGMIFAREWEYITIPVKSCGIFPRTALGTKMLEYVPVLLVFVLCCFASSTSSVEYGPWYMVHRRNISSGHAYTSASASYFSISVVVIDIFYFLLVLFDTSYNVIYLVCVYARVSPRVCSVGYVPKYTGGICSVTTLPNHTGVFGAATVHQTLRKSSVYANSKPVPDTSVRVCRGYLPSLIQAVTLYLVCVYARVSPRVCSVGYVPKYTGSMCSVTTLPNHTGVFGTATVQYRTLR